ncbi:MAG: HypC/HybG/HupF family hydrogenase formation chaperone [Sulfurovum sp.]|nr:HypC/HybG/HupF family hydrogenase formation chaperone [Sulfurovum sp.]MCB4763261.1 HypC/HybG/HupF family hydrogenase formation chaperone [Sulfurovum sp.]MCB4773349.1 HypC/HybG/HupF family hydrogenase formation chaperone [Sulfurovum sp.]MCB4782229.1 HypC/HybG/HupF family hydrogenase formation chaperone [Sulfurovum sp.]
MCLSIPSKVVKVSDDKMMCTVDTMGVQRDANLMMMEDDDVQVGDYVLLHIGFVMNKIDEEEALASIETYREILEVMDEQERRQAILEDDECEARGEQYTQEIKTS